MMSPVVDRGSHNTITFINRPCLHFRGYHRPCFPFSRPVCIATSRRSSGSSFNINNWKASPAALKMADRAVFFFDIDNCVGISVQFGILRGSDRSYSFTQRASGSMN